METTGNPPAGKKQRNMGIELLRAVSMLMVVILHLTGAILPKKNGPGNLYEVVWFLESATFCAVNCFAMISGYVNAGSRVSFGRALDLWLQTAFYSVGLALIFLAVSPDLLTAEEWKKALMPVLYGQYWYISAYFGLMILMPVIDLGLRHISDARLGAFAVLVPLYYIFPQFVSGMNNFTVPSGGYSLIWLVILYIFGAFLGRCAFLRRVKPWMGTAVYALMAVISWAFRMMGREFLVYYTSPTVFLAAAALVVSFAGIRIKSRRAVRIVSFLSAGSLGVFMLHANSLVMNGVLDGMLKPFTKYGGTVCAVLILALGPVIFLFCEVADWLRRLLFRAARIDRAGSALDSFLSRHFPLDKGRES